MHAELNFEAIFMGVPRGIRKKGDAIPKSGEHILQHIKSFFGGWLGTLKVYSLRLNFMVTSGIGL